MRDNYEKRVRAINWLDFETAYGTAARVGEQLIDLASSDDERAVDAANYLWAGLCHQHAYVSSAALPASSFIIEVLGTTSPTVALEILDILLGFAVCTKPSDSNKEEWEVHHHQRLVDELPTIRAFVTHREEELSDMASAIVEILECGS